jgi:hypothetical protein
MPKPGFTFAILEWQLRTKVHFDGGLEAAITQLPFAIPPNKRNTALVSACPDLFHAMPAMTPKNPEDQSSRVLQGL